MKTVSLTRFPLPPDHSLERLEAEFSAVAPHFRQIPGLIQKVFLVSEDGRSAGGCYLWDNLASARAFSEGPLRGLIRDRYGVECEIQYFHAPVVTGATLRAGATQDAVRSTG